MQRRSASQFPALQRAQRLRVADWAFHAHDKAVLDALANGKHAASLREYFGREPYEALSRLSLAARKVALRPGPRVLVLPGIMGSKLGRPAVGNRTPDVLWIDPLRIVAGDLKDLVLPAGGAFKALGVLLFSYAKLALSLRLAGIEPNFHPYDWRLGLDELGEELAQSILADGRPVTLIAHSMGGLVARMAMSRLPQHRVRRLIMLGTPNFGSFAAVQAIRGTYPFVRKIAALDPEHSPEFLTRHVFRTFPGLYQLLPAAPGHEGADLFCTSSWPRVGLRPITRLLARAQGVRAALAPAESRMVQIVGVNRETVVGVRRSGGQFEYALGLDGDGTVPLRLALMRKLKTYFVEESHANLANNDRVIRACIDLIGRGRSRALPTRWVHRRAAGAVTNDARLRASDGPKIDWRRLTSKQRESLLAELNDGSPGQERGPCQQAE